MILTLHIALGLAVLWALVERRRRRSLKKDLEAMYAHRDDLLKDWDRDQRELFCQMRRAARAEASLRFYGHQVPSE